MDLAIGAKRIYVMRAHLSKDGQSKFLAACTYQLTGLGCVRRVYTDLATLELTPKGVKVLELVGGITPECLQEITPVPLDISAVTQPPTAG